MSSQQIVQRSPAQELIARVREEDFLSEVGAALPPTISPEKFVRATVTALLEKPELAEADQRSLFTALLKSAQMGLMPDGREAAINIYKTKVTQNGQEVWISKAQLLPMIHGQRKKLDEHGWTLRTAVVYANDEFRHVVIDGEESIMHAPVRPGAERGELIAAYAIAKHRDGRRMQVVLHPDDIARRRAKAKTQKVWEADTAAMWEKSAGHDLFDQIGFGALSDRATRFLDSIATDPSGATRLMYGPPNETSVALPPAGVGNQPGRADGAPSTPGGQSAADTDASREPQQHNGVAADPAAVAPPGGDEPEPSLDDEPAQQQFTTPTGVDDDPMVAAARAASQFQIPNGQHKGLALAELQAKGEKGTSWLRWALKQGDKLQPDDYRGAVWAFARVYSPDLYTEVLAWHESQVQS